MPRRTSSRVGTGITKLAIVAIHAFSSIITARDDDRL
jgi:hypothetical protein